MKAKTLKFVLIFLIVGLIVFNGWLIYDKFIYPNYIAVEDCEC